MAIFDSKNWNDAVFQKYLKKIPNLKENSLIKNGVFEVNNSLKTRLKDGVGGNLLIEPIKGLIDGDVVNYDGSTNITTTSRDTFQQKKIVVGRAKGWEEKDFSTELTGEDFMPVASEVAEYFQGVDMQDVLSILSGIFSMTSTSGLAFANAHTLDITSEATPTMGATTINSAAQKAFGDKKKFVNMAFMHSYVATGLENLQLLDYLKYTDENGIQSNIEIAQIGNKTVIIDDDMPTTDTVTTAPVYSTTISTAATAGDKITINGTEYTFVANSASDTGNKIKVGADGTAAQQATNIAAKVTIEGYTITASTSKVVFTAASGTNPDQPSVVATKAATTGTIVITNATDTAAVVSTAYTTYLLGKGAFEYCNIGAKVPSEVQRDPSTNGGVDKLYTRQRKLYAPKYVSWEGASNIISPTAQQLATGSNWDVVNNGQSGDDKKYVNHKLLPFARIITKG